MNSSSTKLAGSANEPPSRQPRAARPFLLLLVFFLLGIAVSAVWFYGARTKKPAAQPGSDGALSESTRSVLGRLNSPVEIRFYSLLDPSSTTEDQRALAQRVEDLLAQYAAAADGKIKVTRIDSNANGAANAALADGIRPFNLDKGEGSYFGIAVLQDGRKASLPQLSPEWAQALEPDLSRAIANVTTSSGQTAGAASADPAVAEEVKRAVPNYDSLSLEEGTQLLRDAALKDFTSAVNEMKLQVKQAEQAVLQAQNGGTEADQQAAVKHLQEVQAEQEQKLQQVALRSKAQVDALQRLKAGR